MYLLGKIKVTAVIPKQLSRLKDIAYNLWWSWNSEAVDLYREIDLLLWEKSGKNPVHFIQDVSQKRLYEKINDPEFIQRYQKVVGGFDAYLKDTDTWFNKNCPNKKDHMVAYFSAEFGLNEVLPIYSGGLGVLSGDHCKSASDLGIPFTAIGLFYKQGYFIQRINHEGWQETIFNDLNIASLPIEPALDSNGNEVQINIELPDRVVYAKVWRVNVGRISLYLIDTDVEQNSSSDRWLTARLYGGDQETRIQQEIFLGIGGIKVLDALGINATVYHMNEGHSAFMGLELIRKLISERKLTFKEAKEVVSASTVFTTHTSVPAGNDVFPYQMIDKYFCNYWGALEISKHEFLDLGLKVNDHQNFNMTVLAMTLAGIKNGVSKLHGAVSRNIFNSLWPGVPEDEVPITYVTNGIHTLTWLSPGFKNIYDRYLVSDWEKNLQEKSIWNNIDNIPVGEIWNTHQALKTKMIGFIRKSLLEQSRANGESPEYINQIDTLLDPNVLTIGFARRFATYKRANLIFRNVERIKKILNNPKMPVQIIFAGKAHPADRPAHEIIKNINDIAQQEGFKGKVVLIENYNMTLARNLVHGVDVWLNNPRRPLEASGTSGQKVSVNGILNFSILDGWWCEGYNGSNGWAIGHNNFYENDYFQDNADSESMYNILEQYIVPKYYDRNENGFPENWVDMMKKAIKSLSFQYSTHRMVMEYTDRMYVLSMERVDEIKSSNYEYVRELVDWKSLIEKNWSQVHIAPYQLKEQKSVSGESININIIVYLASIDPSSVKVELYYGIVNSDGKIENPEIKEMKLTREESNGTYRYAVDIRFNDGGEYGYTFRVIPYNPKLINKFDTGLIRWVVE
jgi:glycogen phosphorylase